MRTPRRSPLPRRAGQSGFVLIALIALLAMGGLYFFISNLTPEAIEARRQAKTEAVLVQARDALIGYAAIYRDTHAAEVFGYLPCPDTTGNGNAAANCGTAGEASVGLLPFKTLGLPDLRDSTGVCLWYAVSGNFKNSPKGITAAVPLPMNWDTQGQFRVLDANATVLVAPDDGQGGAAAVIFVAGPPLEGQNRTPSANEPCQIDPAQVAAYLDGTYAFNTANTIPLTQGPVKDVNGNLTNNDRLAWITPREIFDRVIKRQDFSNTLTAAPAGQISTLSNEIKVVLEKWIQDELTTPGTHPASNFVANAANYSTYIGDVQPGVALATTTFNQTYKNYFDNWSNQFRLRICSNLGTPCLAINNGTTANCRGALMFAGRNTSGPRTTAQQQPSIAASLGYFFETGLALLNGSATEFNGNATYTDSGTDASRMADVGTCLFPGEFKSFAQDIAAFATGVTYSGATPSVSVDTSAKTVTLGDTTGGSAGSGCVWHATAVPLSTNLRLYFRLQFATKGNGFTLALADGATNLVPNYWSRPQIMCGAADSASLGYAGTPPSGAFPGIQRPKLGIEFDTLFSGTQKDPPGDHMAVVYWGSTADTDGADDNTHYLGNGGVAVTSANWAGSTATATTASPHGFAVGQVVLVSGLVPAGYNGTVTISSIPSTTQFSYALTSNPGASTVPGQAKAISTGSAPRNPRVATAILNAAVAIVDGDTVGATTRKTAYDPANQWVSIVTSAPHGLSAGQQVVIAGVSPAAYNGTFKVLSSGLYTTQPYQFRYSMAADPGNYVSGGTANRVKGTELSSLTWAGGTTSAASPASHGLDTGQNITTHGMTPNGFGTTANLTKVDSTHFTYPLATDPVGSFSTETPTGMAMVKTSNSNLPYSTNTGFPASTSIYVRLDLNRRYDVSNHVAVLDMKAYILDRVNLADSCLVTDLQNLALDMSTLCPNLAATLQQDSIPINALATLSNAVWSSGQVAVTTAAAHGLVSGSSVTISGVTPGTSKFNGTFTITVTGANTFTYAAATDPGTYGSGGDIQPLSTLYFGFTNARGSSNSGENQSITLYDLLMRSQ